MRAVRWHAAGDVRLEDVPDPGAPPPGWLRIRVTACGLCGTDLEEYRSGPVFLPIEPHPLTGRCAPLTLGHEFVGVVDAAGDGTTIAEGTAVAVDGNMTCGECAWCRTGRHNLCPLLAQLGQKADGGLAEFVLAPAYTCVPYAGIPAEVAAFAEPLSVAVRAVSRANLPTGGALGVVGGGTIGLLVARVAALAGAGPVVLVEPHADRRALAARLGVSHPVAPDAADALIADLTGGTGLPAVVEAAGGPGPVVDAVRRTARGGRTILLSVFDADVPVPMMDVLTGEKEIVASLSHRYDTDFPAAVRLLESGAVDPAPLISDRLGLDEAVDGFRALAEAPDRHLKVLVTPRS